MKKMIILVIALVLLVSTAMAEGYAPLSDEELLALYQQVSSELSLRNLSTAIDPSAADIQLRLYQFYQFWSHNDLRNMLSLCSPKWVTEQDEALQSLFAIIRNRTAQSIENISVSGSPEDTVREVVFNTMIDKNNGKDPMMYTVHITMVQEDDGTWYIDPASMTTNEPVVTTPVPEMTPVPEGTAAGITGNTVPDSNPDEDLENRLNEFLAFWSANDYPNMLELCASSWKEKQENPLHALFAVLRNRTPISFEFVAVSGKPADKVRTITTNIQMDNHSGKAPRTYSIDYVMVQENDGLWYIDPASLMTNEPSASTIIPEELSYLDGQLQSALEFMHFWRENDYPGMLTRCASDWKSKQENPTLSLYMILKGRLLMYYEILSDSGTQAESVRSLKCCIETNWNTGKPNRKYIAFISMVQEEDGLWYVDPTSLETDEIPEATLEPDPTPTPVDITGDTILYYNPEGGSRYHLDPNCKSVNARYLPMQGTVRYSDINDPQYQELKPCRICLAPERQSGDYNALTPADYTQKAWAFTAENYAELLRNPDSMLNQPYCAKGMVQEVISENPLIIVIDTCLEENGDLQPVIIESPDASKFHWEKGCEYQIYGDFVAVRDGMPVLNARFSFTW